MPRPTDYKPEYDEQTQKLCRLGATDLELADFFGVAESTINLWKLKNPSFSESIKKGKVVTDVDVADRLYQRATGFEWDEQVPTKVKEVTYENGKRVREIEHVEVTVVHKVVPPDTTAAIFWLKNRRRIDWRDRQEVEHGGKNGDPIALEASITYYPKGLPEGYWKNGRTLTDATDDNS